VDICHSNPCLNGGICSRTSVNSYTCVCTYGFQGPNCAIQIDPCVSAPCYNGGLCLQTNSDTS